LLVPDNDHYFHADGISLEEARVNGKPTVIMYDANVNPFWEEARNLKSQGRFREAREGYRQAWNFNPYDARRRIIGLEWAEILEDLGEHQEADRLRGLVRGLEAAKVNCQTRQENLSSSRQGA